MHVLHLIDAMEGGNAKQLHWLATRGAGEHHVVSMAPVGKKTRREWAERGIPVYEARKRFAYDPFLTTRLLLLAGKIRPERVHVWGVDGLREGLFCARFCGAQTVATLRHADPWKTFSSGPFAKYDFLVANNAGVRRFYESRSCVGNWSVIPDAVPEDFPQREENGGVTVACVGPMRPWKRWKWAIWSIDSIVRLYPDAKLLFFGERDGPTEVFARQYERAEIVSFTGSEANVRALLPQCRMLWCPQSVPGAGLAMLEAMAAGVPVVATQTDGIHDLLPENAGWFVPVEGETIAMAAAAHHILTHPEEVREKTALARAYVREHFTPEKMVAQYMALFTSQKSSVRPATRES
ncbi:MAG: glycosyltransferase family 4 protein [Planctomycetia bacterium]|nr:glycosyltransferase family 4 protein [Planctomycetia bacterium]